MTDQNNNVMGWQSASDDGDGFAAVDIQFSGSPDSTYTARAVHKAYADQWDYEYSNWPRVTTIWYDFYDFSDFETQGIEVPWYYGFLGPGPEVTRPSQQIILGSTHDEASVATPGAPDHLKVVTDDMGVDSNCTSTVARRIKFKVVDINNTQIGTTSVQELYSSISSNTCSNGPPTPESCSSLDSDGTFTDYISVACNSVGGSCGYTITDKWQWCPSGQTPKTLGTLLETVHNDAITVNGVVGPKKLKGSVLP